MGKSWQLATVLFPNESGPDHLGGSTFISHSITAAIFMLCLLNIQTHPFSFQTCPLQSKILVRPWPDWPERLLCSCAIRDKIFGPSCVCLRGITLHFSGQSYGFTFSTTKRFLFPYMANTFVAAVKVRDAPGHTLWWSSNELNILTSSCLHSKVTMQILSVDYLLFRFTHFISYSHA